MQKRKRQRFDSPQKKTYKSDKGDMMDTLLRVDQDNKKLVLCNEVLEPEVRFRMIEKSHNVSQLPAFFTLLSSPPEICLHTIFPLNMLGTISLLTCNLKEEYELRSMHK